MAHHLPHAQTRIWARQLLNEFEDICWQYDLDLVPPVIEISGNTSRVGSWQAGARTIRISSQLIINHPWDVTINILKHEIAHQICSELFQDNTAGHGQKFHQACDMIGLVAEYRTATGDLDTLVTRRSVNPLPTGAERMTAKVHKLLALAGSGNSHEAALAMKKANEVLRKYNLDLIENNTARRFSYLVINLKKKQIKSYQRHICAILTDFFFVRIITASTYDPPTDKSFKIIEILGTPENIAIAEHCYHFLEDRLETLWKKEKHRFSANTLTEKNSFYLGMLKGFRNRLADGNKKAGAAPAAENKTDDNLHALMVLEDRKLNEYVTSRFPKLTKVAGRRNKIYRNTFAEGIKTGQKITLHKCVHAKTAFSDKFLTD